MNIFAKFKRNAEISKAQADQQLQNCALLCAYVFGQPGGWFAICHGSIDGFRSDYAYIHYNEGNFTFHPVRAFYLAGSESELQELDEIREACRNAQRDDEPAPVVTFTNEEILSAKAAVREAFTESGQENMDAFIRELCDHSISVLDGCDWQNIATEIQKNVSA